ncbi:MAG: 50S ribosomal protein L24 [Minisyncoccia bacterium]
MKIKKGDLVKILKGKDRGKTGKVIKVFTRDNKVTVEGLNLFKKHVRPRRQGEKGEIVQVARPLAIANVMLICPSCGKATRVGYRFENNNKVRYCKKCESKI